MNFTEITAPQGSEEWFAARAGRLTGSNAKHIMATVKVGEAAARRDYRAQLVVERLTGKPQVDGFQNAEMKRGIDLEPMARAALEARQGYLIRQTGFLSCTNRSMGCSLDGDVDNYTGIIELKCPKSATHMRYWTEGVLPYEHRFQVYHNLLVTGAEWLDFASYDDRFPPAGQLWVVRVNRADVATEIMAYKAEADRFLGQVQAELDHCESLMR